MKIIILMVLLSMLLIGCMESTSFSGKHKVICQDVCLNEDLQLRYVGQDGENIICHCEKRIII